MSMTWLSHSLCNLSRFPFISMPDRERRRCVLNAPSWGSKRLLTQDDTLQTFSWPYDTGALINEMKLVSEILELYEKVQQPTDMAGYFAMTMHFEDAFIDSHEFLVELLDRLIISWNNSAQENIILMHDGSRMENEAATYKNANSIYKYTRERLLRMRSLYEQLKPETQGLVQRCSSFLQIENSMLAQKKAAKAPVQQSVNSMPFQPACGFRLETTLLTSATIHDRISDVDLQLTRMQMEKDMLLQKRNDYDMLEDAMETCDRLRIILCNGKGIVDAMEAVEYAHAFLAPYKNTLERHSSIFEHTLYVFPDPFPEAFPSTCTADDVVAFYHEMLLALDKDNEHITLLRSKI